VRVESRFDPDLVEELRVEYELPAALRPSLPEGARQRPLLKQGLNLLELAVVVPDERRHLVRARAVVRFTDGRTVSQTAVHWIDLGAEDPPEGMIGRIVDPDGTGIRIYRGITVREQR
jgi:hypothetical protein